MQNVSMEQIRQMLIRSQRLNEMKAEIDAAVSMALGLLTKAELSRYRFHEVACQFTTPGLEWKFIKNKRDLTVEATPAGKTRSWYAYISDWGTERTPMEYVELVYQALPEVYTNLVKTFPSLSERLAPLLKAEPQQ